MKKYKHLFFDLDNTLYDFTSNSYLALKDAFESLGLLEKINSFDDFFAVYQKINEQLWAEYRDKKISKDALRGKRFADSFAAFSIEPGLDPILIDNKYLSIMPEKIKLFPDAIEVLGELVRRGYKLHIITNGFREVQHDKLLNTGLSTLIDKVFISEDIKTTKPSREIFEHALKSCNARKKESLMIGDSWETDIVGAKKFGIDQVYFTPYEDCLPMELDQKPTYHILSLNELRTILI